MKGWTYNNNFYIFGGRYDYSNYCNDLFQLNIQTFKWKKINNLNNNFPSKRSRYMIYQNQSIIILFGGQEGRSYFNDFYLFSCISNQFQKLNIINDIPEPREFVFLF